jgi:hypothetical protein
MARRFPRQVSPQKITKILARRPFATAGGGVGFVYDANHG